MTKLSILETARALVKRGYSIIPVDKNKNPTVKRWDQYQEKPMSLEEVEKLFAKAEGVALLAGGKHNVSIIDFDIKYSLDEELYEKVLEQVPTSIFKKMLIHKTVNGGFHWLFSCPTGIGNIKLAQRETTDQEVLDEMMRSVNTVGAKQAMKQALGDKVRVLIETRSFTTSVNLAGEMTNKASGYVVFPPTAGYEYVEGKLGKITPAELDTLLTVMRSFNTYVPEKYSLKTGMSLGTDIWEEANNRLDTVKMLTDVGWRVVWENDKEVRLLRPGQVSSATSAIYHKDSKIFVPFSSSTVFDPGKGYSPAMVFIELEEGDAASAKAKLTQILA